MVTFFGPSGELFAVDSPNGHFGAEPVLALVADSGEHRLEIHTDIMFGTPEVSIRATRTKRGEVPLLESGRWAPGL